MSTRPLAPKPRQQEPEPLPRPARQPRQPRQEPAPLPRPDDLICVLTRTFAFPSEPTDDSTDDVSGTSGNSGILKESLAGRLRRKMLSETSGSLVVPGPLLILQKQPVTNKGTTTTARDTNKADPKKDSTAEKSFQVSLTNCSIHWSWEDAFSSDLPTCLLTLLSTSGSVEWSSSSSTAATASTEEACQITFQGFQLTLEQKEPPAQSQGSKSAQDLHPIKAFCKFDAIHGFDRIWHNLVLSSSLESLKSAADTGKTSSAFVPLWYRLHDLQVSCPLMNIDGAAAVASRKQSKKASSIERNIFLAKWLGWLHAVATPSATVQSPSASTLQIDMTSDVTTAPASAPANGATNGGSNLDDSILYVPLFPQYDDDDKEEGDKDGDDEEIDRDPLKLEGGIQTLGDVFRIYYNASQDALLQVPAFNPHRANSRMESLNKWGDKLKRSMSDSLTITAGCVATGASFVTPVGAVVSVATLAFKDSLVDASHKGKKERGADGKDGYKVGDISRGISTTVKDHNERSERGLRRPADDFFDPQKSSTDEAATGDRPKEDDGDDDDDKPLLPSQQSWQEKSSRYAGAAGSSVGAAAGFALGGPIGLIAGSLAGSVAGSRSVAKDAPPAEATTTDVDNPDKVESDATSATAVSSQPPSWQTATANIGAGAAAGLLLGGPIGLVAGSIIGTAAACRPTSTPAVNKQAVVDKDAAKATTPTQNKEAPKYRFGDMTRRVVARGKQSIGRDSNDGYKFGDFARGFISRDGGSKNNTQTE